MWLRQPGSLHLCLSSKAGRTAAAIVTDCDGVFMKVQVPPTGSYRYCCLAWQGLSLEEMGIAGVKARYPSSIDQRIHSVEEVANLVVYICSIQASATTGSALRADGGIVECII